MSALVIGYGNELRGDDGIGPYLANAVAERAWPGVRALAVHQLTPELAQLLAEVNVVVFVDANGDGHAEDIDVRRIECGLLQQSSTHCGDPRALLALCKELYGRAPVAWLVAVRGSDFGYGLAPSAAAMQRCARALERIEGLLSKSAVTARR